jgi:RecA/RadA recombinase
MQALAVAGPASGSQALAVGSRQRQRMLSCGDEALDAFLGGLERGRLTFLDSASPLVWDVSFGAVCQAARGGTAIVVDGGNSADPYVLAAHARRSGLAPRAALGAVRVARAFTAYQMSAIVEETLPAEALDHPPALVLASCLPELYLDEDVPWHEGDVLVERAVALLRQLARTHDCVALATNLGMAKLAARPRMRAALYGADRVVRLLRAREGALVQDGARALAVQAAPRAQRTLPEFLSEAPRANPPLRGPSLPMLRGAD